MTDNNPYVRKWRAKGWLPPLAFECSDCNAGEPEQCMKATFCQHRDGPQCDVLDEDWLADVIADSLDMDWTPRDAARAIIKALSKNTRTALATQPATSQGGEASWLTKLREWAMPTQRDTPSVAALKKAGRVISQMHRDKAWISADVEETVAVIQSALAATPTPPTLSEDLREAIASELPRVWTDFLDANPDDLTSPEDMPDHAYMTGQQFEDWALEAFDRAALALAQVKAS